MRPEELTKHYQPDMNTYFKSFSLGSWNLLLGSHNSEVSLIHWTHPKKKYIISFDERSWNDHDLNMSHKLLGVSALGKFTMAFLVQPCSVPRNLHASNHAHFHQNSLQYSSMVCWKMFHLGWFSLEKSSILDEAFVSASWVATSQASWA